MYLVLGDKQQMCRIYPICIHILCFNLKELYLRSCICHTNLLVQKKSFDLSDGY